MMNMFSPFPPKPEPNWHELPEGAAMPIYWKTLGHIAPGIEVHYGIETYHGDMDVDREAELRLEVHHMARVLDTNNAFTGDMVFTAVGRPLVVRIVACDCVTCDCAAPLTCN